MLWWKFTQFLMSFLRPYGRDVCFCHDTYALQSESTLYSCLNIKELLARSRREIWSLSDCNWTLTQNHLVSKRTLNHLAKLFVYELSGLGFESSCSHLNFKSCTCFDQGVPCNSGNYRVWIHSKTYMWHDKFIQSNAPYR